MNVSTKSRIIALLGAVALITVAACADTITAPAPKAARALRDTTYEGGGDTTLCRSGWVVIGSKVVCNEM